MQYTDGREKRPLDKVAAERKLKWESLRTISGPTKVVLPGGECVQYAVEVAVPRCGHINLLSDKGPKMPCVLAHAEGLCYNKQKSYFKLSFDLSRYYEKGQADEKAKNNSNIFEGVMKNLEFK